MWLALVSTTSTFAASEGTSDNSSPRSASPPGRGVGSERTDVATRTAQSTRLDLPGEAVSALTSSSSAGTGLQFIPVAPCRIADTRGAKGAFGGPGISAGGTREFDITQSACSIPGTAVAYSLNVTVVPSGALSYLTLWPSGQPQPNVSTLNSPDGRIKANAAITPAGIFGGVDVFASNATNVILDINGYFVPAGTASALAYYPVTPCRVVDTRNTAGIVGGPFIGGGASRSFPISSGNCGIPAGAQAFSLNVTAIPHTKLDYLTAWPTGQAQPNVSTLNSLTGAIAANAAIMPAGGSGATSIFMSDDADAIVDIDGYFAPPSSNGLSLFTTTPCRVVDTRSGSGMFDGVLAVAVAGSTCAPPSTAQAFVLNATVVPPGPLDYLTLWPDGQTQPVVSTLNALDGAITSNMAIVPTANGTVDLYASNSTQTILDISSYFAPPAAAYTLTVDSTNPNSGISVTVVPADNKGVTGGSTSFNLTYTSGTSVTLKAAATSGSNVFSSWTGCASTSGVSCTLTISGNMTASANYTPPVYTLTVNSLNAPGVAISLSPTSSVGAGNTPFQVNYYAGTTVTLVAPATASGNNFVSWTGCTSVSAETCTESVTGNATLTVNYTASTATVTAVAVSPNPGAINVGATQQFTATLTGTGAFTKGVTWSVDGILGGDAIHGTVSSTGLYVTPYPVPAPPLNITATSIFDPSKSGSAPLNITVASAGGPNLAIDAAAANHPISPLIYGMNAFSPTGNFATLAAEVRLPVDRWGGDQTTRYNYLLDVYNSASDYYYESYLSSNTAAPGPPDNSVFNQQVVRDRATGTKTLGTMPLIGWTTKQPPMNPTCGFSVKKYGLQQKTDPYNPDCGNGTLPNGQNLTGNDPKDTSFAIDQSFTTGWMQYLIPKYGTAANGGVAIYDLDNEPEYWGFVHHDVHPAELTYDELTTKGLAYAKAIKDVDPTALVSGPIISSWNGYFYSPADWVSGWSTGPYYVYNDNPVDRLAHNNTPLMDYYLQHFKSYDDANHLRLLDYVDIHTYFAANGAAFAEAGATDLQIARVNSTRAFWDPTYTDPNYTDPENRTNTAVPVPPMLIRRLKTWVANDYPGTKTSIDEYNWGAQDHVNGAVAQADILGIFGREGLDLGALWGAPDPGTQRPSVNAFKVFRNYDPANAGQAFGETSVSATSSDQSMLSVYAATRAADHVLTVVVINKSYSNLSSTLSLANVAATGPAKVFLYSNANLSSIVAQPNVTVSGNALTTTFPAQSITILVIPE